MRRPSLFQKDQKLWALGWNIKDFGFFKYILYFQTRFIVAGSFNNERGFYSLVLVHHEHPCPVLDFRGWMKDSRKQMGSTWTRSAQPASQPGFPLGNKIVQWWTAVPRAGHIGREITHSIYGPPRVWRLTDLTIPQQQTEREKVSHKVTHHPSHSYKALQVNMHVAQRRAQPPQSTPASGLSARGLGVFLCSPGVRGSFSRPSTFLTQSKNLHARSRDKNSAWTAWIKASEQFQNDFRKFYISFLHLHIFQSPDQMCDLSPFNTCS